ncbi:unnamed protein product [Clonostachys rosea]|uniref:FAD-binding domain-containing protein n=1 Tax=Bionectria ochroleuca TaxID=29856 RepID=A0ABY6TX72_BIOOC|nr:unnamed protein product [Clonostachys rosea]
MAQNYADILIVGAGVVGLTLAQSLEQHGISYQIFERDESITSRGNGWGITIHWSRFDLQKCIPKGMYDQLPSISVDPDMKKKDPGHYKFLNLATLERKFAAPVDPERMRIRREGFRQLLATPNLNILWGTKIEEVVPQKENVSLTLPDQSTWTGKLLIGADGSSSAVRSFLCPGNSDNIPLPVRFIGCVIKMTPEACKSITDVTDPLTFQGCHPESGVYMFWCLVSTPETNGSEKSTEPYFQVQVCVSWKPVEGEGEVPATQSGKIQKLRELCDTMAKPLRDMIYDMKEDNDPIAIKLQDWPCLDWDNFRGRVTLAGDSAHAMTMYRGEAANFGITDAADISEAIVAFMKEGASQADAIGSYETKLRERSQAGVLRSRQACMDAHDFESLTEKSPLLFNR